jgi:MFS family permease
MATVTTAAALPRRELSSLGLVVVALAALDFGLESSMIVPAIPDLAVHYDASLIAVGWLATGFLLAAIVAVPLLSRLGDLYGKRRLLLFALGAFLSGSLICAFTTSIELAIVGRAVQGLGAAAGPLTLALARDTVAPPQLPRVVGAVMVGASVGGGVGFLLGGIVVDLFSPAAIFWLLAGLAACLILAITQVVPETPVRKKVRLDLAGIALLGAGLAVLLLAISKGHAWAWSSPEILGLFAGAALLLAAFVLVERRVSEPYVDLSLVARTPFANVNVCSFCFGFGFFVMAYVIPQIGAASSASGYGLDLSTSEIGLLLVPSCLASLTASFVCGEVVDRVGPRLLVSTGAVCGVGGNLSLALAHDSVAAIALGSAVVGTAWGTLLTVLYIVVLRHASADKSAIATSIAAISRQVGLSIGVTLAFVLVTAVGFSGEFPSDSGYTAVFVMGAIGASVTLLAALTLPGRWSEVRYPAGSAA